MIDVAFTLEEVSTTPLDGAAVVVIDVVRASTTMVAALAHGARAVVPVGTPEEAVTRAAALAPMEALVGGERGGAPPAGFECGNSPAEYTPQRVRGRAVVFTTTNGTRALLAVSGAAAVAVGGFVNAEAVVRWAMSRPGDLVLACAGERGRFCLEDATCAGLLVTRLVASRPETSLTDAARAATALWARYAGNLADMLADAAWAQALVRQGRGGDLPLCVAIDAYDVVPVVRDGALLAATQD